MATSVLDVRDTVAPSYVRVQRPVAEVDALPVLRRVPAPALLVGVLSVLQALGLLAVGLTQIDGVLSSAVRPSGWLIVVGLVVLAGWIVLAAGGGAALAEGSNRRLLVVTSSVELLLAGLLGVVALVRPIPEALTFGLPLPVAFACAVAVPVTKLLLADAPTARRWVAQPARPRIHRPDPATAHRALCTATLGLIALGLGAAALLTPVEANPENPASSVVYQP